MAHVYGIDLGTSTFKMYSAASNKILTEKNVVAIVNREDVYAFGDEAYEMYEKAPEHIDIVFPVQNGVITDIDDMEMLMMCFQEKLNHGKLHYNSDYVICVPTDITDVEKRAFYDLVYESRLRSKRVFMVEKPIADAIGCGVDVIKRKGAMIVNVGADTTEISVVSQGGIVVSKLIKVGGRFLDNTIVAAVKKQHHIVIGNKTAEQLKITLAATDGKDALKESCKIYGMNLVNGLPRAVDVSSELVCTAIKEALDSIVACAKVVSERIPPEIASDVEEYGIYLTGGCSQIPGLADLIAKECQLQVNKMKQPECSAILGISKIIKTKAFHPVMYAPKQREA